MVKQLYCVYLITNKITGMQYIGRSKYKPEYRFRGHLNSSRNDPALFHTPFSVALRIYGADNFEIKTIEIRESKSIIEDNFVEQEYIKKYNTFFPNGYNISGLSGDQLINYRNKYNNYIDTGNIYKEV